MELDDTPRGGPKHEGWRKSTGGQRFFDAQIALTAARSHANPALFTDSSMAI